MSEIATEQATEVPAPQTEQAATQVDAPQGEPKVFDEAYVKELRDEAASYRVKAKKLEDDLKNAKSQDEVQKLIADYGREIHARDVQIVAMKHKLPDALVGRLKGDTLEELEKDAAELAKLLNPEPTPANPRVTQPGGGLDPTRQAAPAVEDPAVLAQRISRRRNRI